MKVVQNYEKREMPERVRVAVIDDGIDGSLEYFYNRDNIADGETFLQGQGSGNRRPGSFYATSGGHGTLMAKLICRLCPQASLYVAKIGDTKRGFTADCAAEVNLSLFPSRRQLDQY